MHIYVGICIELFSSRITRSTFLYIFKFLNIWYVFLCILCIFLNIWKYILKCFPNILCWKHIIYTCDIHINIHVYPLTHIYIKMPFSSNLSQTSIQLFNICQSGKSGIFLFSFFIFVSMKYKYVFIYLCALQQQKSIK